MLGKLHRNSSGPSNMAAAVVGEGAARAQPGGMRVRRAREGGGRGKEASRGNKEHHRLY